MEKTFSILAILSIAVVICAQDAPAPAPAAPAGWKLTAQSNLTLSLNTYSDNWAGSELGSMSWIAQFNGTAERAFGNCLNKNTLKLSFGQAAVEQKDTAGEKKWGAFEKATDLIDFESVLFLNLPIFIQPFVSVRALSQFLDESDTLDTWYLNPAEFTESFGGAREIIKSEPLNWNSRLGGAVKQKVNRHSPVAAAGGVAYESRIVHEGGLEFVNEWKGVNKAKWLTYVSLLRVYEALISSASDDAKGTPAADYWRYPDVAWDNTLTMNLSKYIMFNFYAQILYDREIDNNIRYKEIFGVGLTYIFQ